MPVIASASIRSVVLARRISGPVLRGAAFGCASIAGLLGCGGQVIADSTPPPAGGGGETSASAGCPGLGGPSMVRLPQGYCIDTTEVTRGQYQAWLDATVSTSGWPSKPGCEWNSDVAPDPDCMSNSSACQGSDCTDHPVVCVDWCDADTYCRAVGKRLCGRIDGQTNGSSDDNDATTNEWCSACSSHGRYRYPYGDAFQPSACNSSQHTVAVRSVPSCQSLASGYTGIYDLSGNVWEWEDCDLGSTHDCRVRGGSFTGGDFYLRCVGDHYLGGPEEKSADLGFRCCSR